MPNSAVSTSNTWESMPKNTHRSKKTTEKIYLDYDLNDFLYLGRPEQGKSSTTSWPSLNALYHSYACVLVIAESQ